MADVFVSYKAEDRSRVAPIVAALDSEGLTVWWDAHIAGGEEWREVIQSELDAARCVIVIWSVRSVGPEGRFVRDEASRADRRSVYLPVRIDAVEPPLGFGETQALSLIGWKGNRADPRWATLIQAVRTVLAQKSLRILKPASTMSLPNRRVVLAGGAALAVSGAAASWWWWQSTAADTNRLAVLPFANLSGDAAQGYLGDGIAEELRTALAKIPELQVMSRMSSESVRGLDAAAAATRLGVSDILAGSIRRSPDLVRVSAQLISGKNGVERWSDSYDRQDRDVLSIQTDIAERVALALSATLAPARAASLFQAGTTNTAAHDLMLRARELGATQDSEEAMRQALSLVDAAVALDPRYGKAHALKAGLMANLAIFFTPEAGAKAALGAALQATRRAISLDPTLPAGYNVLGFLLKGELNFRGALAAYRKANTLGADGGALIGYSFFLAEMGRGADALVPAVRAIAVDPLNPSARGAQGNAYYLAGDYSAAIVALRRMLRAAPDRFYARYYIGLSLMWLGQIDEAWAEFRAMPQGDLFRDTGEAILSARTGNQGVGDRTLATIKDSGATVLLAAVRAQRGERGEALTLLEQAWDSRSPDLGALRADPLYAPLRSEKRFAALIAKLRFP